MIITLAKRQAEQDVEVVVLWVVAAKAVELSLGEVEVDLLLYFQEEVLLRLEAEVEAKAIEAESLDLGKNNKNSLK